MKTLIWPILLGLVVFMASRSTSCAQAPEFKAELIFPLHAEHNHAPGIVEYKNGDLLVSWYRGAGERKADDVAVFGSRLSKDTISWS